MEDLEAFDIKATIAFMFSSRTIYFIYFFSFRDEGDYLL